eukprot:7318512-Alexandrium_andersonii.AAC.1
MGVVAAEGWQAARMRGSSAQSISLTVVTSRADSLSMHTNETHRTCARSIGLAIRAVSRKPTHH